MLLQHVTQILERHGFDWCACHGCFNVAARKRELMLIKVLDNVDSFQEEQAQNLAALSDRLDATVSLIGTHTRHGRLYDSIVYERFDVPTFTPNTLDDILDDSMPHIYSDRGGLFAEINPSALRQARKKANMTQQQLADAIGVTKKSIYEHESKRMRAQNDIVMKIERILKSSVSSPFIPEQFSDSTNRNPSNTFERAVSNQLNRLGFNTYFVGQSPFNVIAEERVMIVSDAEQNVRKIERKVSQLEGFAGVSKQPIVIISEAEPRTNLPSITTAELNNLSARSLRKLAKSKTNSI